MKVISWTFLLVGALVQLKVFVLAFTWSMKLEDSMLRLLPIGLFPVLSISLLVLPWWPNPLPIAFLAVTVPGLIIAVWYRIDSRELAFRTAWIATAMVLYTAFFGVLATVCIAVLTAW
ncbi:hypothetical protein IC757_04990 [Wenzhouxiangella sp. AB-CW3]|uniref:hypothetical protein n=1 Tax=Wenzhouxiangella sp. AB-CW3 TaxID=2771012 RepID=UPI00168A9D1B|nr:hypothetical protein [Wenzhouxiangella sp. AB-CW3]QOC23499.1 hypothetical protein IC757_04990 [Wenzhouxiangella sp. AB-CW3]